MQTKLLRPTAIILLLSLLNSISLKAQAPNFILTDINGIEHNLYEDYLDQGKTVLLSFGATWNIWDTVWLSRGVLQEFQEDYVSTGQAAVIFIDPYNPTLDDLMGNSSGTIGYNFIEAANFPIISTTSDILNTFQVSYFPTIRMICPDGTAYTDGFNSSNTFIKDTSLGYTHLETAEIIAEKMFENCGTSFDLNTIEGLVYNDVDDNCTSDQNELGMANINCLITGPNGTSTRISNHEGVFRKVAAPGTYSISVNPPNELWAACNSPAEISFEDGPTSSQFIDLGLQAIEDCPKLTSNITAPILRRCFEANLYVSYCNEGTLPAEDVEVSVNLDEFMLYVSSDYTPDVIEGQNITFKLGTLEPWECGKITIVFLTDCEAELGTEQCYSTKIDPDYSCGGNLRPTEETECQEIRGAFDPNDKRAFPLSGSDEYEIAPNTTIKYQIRFQNTGTDTAFNVFIEDQISEHLDLRSFRVGQASHNYNIDFDEGRKMTIRFPNIMLPDSNVNLVASNGYINYYIDQIPNLANGTIIENSAGIFFDFNDPVLTNTTRHIVDDGITSTQNLNEINYSVFPNPSSGMINIRIDEKDWKSGRLDIFSLTGKLMYSNTFSGTRNNINVEHLDDGIYLLALTDEQSKKSTQLLSIIDF